MRRTGINQKRKDRPENPDAQSLKRIAKFRGYAMINRQTATALAEKNKYRRTLQN